MLVVALTGGIGSGKTAVSDAFAARGVPVIDTDLIARELVQPGQPALAAIVERFGRDCLNSDGSLNRRWLRAQVFADDRARAELENILHPRIGAEVRDRLARVNAPYCVVVIPLLAETGPRDYVHRVLVVDIPEALQVERVTARDLVDADQARAVIAAQAGREQRLALADEIIANDGSLTQLAQRVEALHQRYLALAQGH